MKKKRNSEEQIIRSIKRQHESGVKVGDICHDLDISNGTFPKWRSRFARMKSSATNA